MAMKLPLSFLLTFLILPVLAPAQEPTETPKPPVVMSSPLAPEDQSADGLDESDPFGASISTSTRGIPKARAAADRPALRLRLETWEAPAIEVAKRLDQLQGADALAKLRAECLNGALGVTLIHSPVLTIDSSTRMLAESIVERIYPTEYEPPSLPKSGDQSSPKEEPPKNWTEVVENALTDTTPTSFETRNTGLTFEAVAQPVTVEEKAWDVLISIDEVRLVQTESFGANALRITMPVFSSFRTGGIVRLKEGQWRLLSVMEPPRGLDGKPSENRWVILVRIDPEN
jgi:hypothetical protein